MKEYKALLNKNCLLLIAANIAYSFADIAFDFFLSWYVYSITGNIMNLIAMLSGSVLFRAVLSLLTGAVTDLTNRKHLLVFSALCSIPIVLSSLLVLRYFSTVIWLYVVIVLLNDVFNVLYSKSMTTISAELFDETTYISFNSAVSALNQSVYVIGQAAMGFILMVARDISVISFVIACLMLTSFLISLIDYQSTQKAAPTKLLGQIFSFRKKSNSYFKNLLNIAKTEVFSDSYYKSFCIVIFTLNLVYGYISSVLPYSLSSMQGMSSAVVGLAKSMLSIGGIIGMLIVPKISKRVTRSFIVGLVGSLISVLCIFVYSRNLILVYIFFFFYSVFDAITQPLYSYTIKRIDARVRGSIVGVIDFVILLASPLGMFICGALADRNDILVEIFIIFIFTLALILVKSSKDLNAIYLE
ncbi:MAG: MFS transporter [Chloroflexi bacterium]|nr:MFS transporter [Chloroflexota bacterium]